MSESVAPRRVLFICQHNSARSQMAEAYLRSLTDPREVVVASAGLEPTTINPLVVEVMAEDGVDLGGARTQSVFDLFRAGRLYDFVIVVCDRETEAKCPTFPGITKRLRLPFPDPAATLGDHEQRLAQTRRIRDEIKAMAARLAQWLSDGAPGSFSG